MPQRPIAGDANHANDHNNGNKCGEYAILCTRQQNLISQEMARRESTVHTNNRYNIVPFCAVAYANSFTIQYS